MGVSDDGKVVVIKLDDGEPEDYAVLHASYDGEGPVTSMVFDGGRLLHLDGLYKIDLPIVVASGAGTAKTSCVTTTRTRARPRTRTTCL